MGYIDDYLRQVRELIAAVSEADIRRVVDAIVATWRAKRHIYVLGNGGSAATASHFACDLGKGTSPVLGPPFKVDPLTDNVALLTAWGNDVSFDDIFANQLKGRVEPGDLVIGISTSGQSSNVLKAMAVARQGGARTVGFVGFDGGKLREMVDLAVIVPSTSVPQCEDIHHILQHLVCFVLQRELSDGSLSAGEVEQRHQR